MDKTPSEHDRQSWFALGCMALLTPLLAVAQGVAPPGPDRAATDAVPIPRYLQDGANLRSDPSADAFEAALRDAVQQALWPADILRLADDYLRLFPRQPWAEHAAVLRERAQYTATLLRRGDVQLFRGAFAPMPGRGAATHDLRLAALGDQAAVLRLARQTQQADGNIWRQVGWLQYGSLLGSEEAAYALALHYRRESQPLLAAQYENRAIDMGFVPPPSLDNVRK